MFKKVSKENEQNGKENIVQDPKILIIHRNSHLSCPRALQCLHLDSR